MKSGIQKLVLLNIRENCLILFTQGCIQVSHCQFRTRAGEQGRRIFSSGLVYSFLERRGLIDRVNITGGEPTLQAGFMLF